MAGLFDGFRIAQTGINVQRTRMEVVGNNIANASNPEYTRQDVRVETNGTVAAGKHFLGQGVKIDEIIRIRDELLDMQLRSSSSSASEQDIKVEWLRKIQTIYNEPSDSGINSALSLFWEAWSDLSNDPESFATRANVISRTENLSSLLNTIDNKLERFEEEADQEVTKILDAINAITVEIAQLNKDIFEIEAGQTSQANDLRDQRDGALDRLAELVEFSTSEANNGMINVFIGIHPAILEDTSEDLVFRSYPLNTDKIQVMWDHGDQLGTVQGGQLAGMLSVRDDIIGSYKAEINSFANLLITEVNKIYSTGSGLTPDTYIESNLGYEALGVSSSTDTLSLLPTGKSGAIHIAFYDSNGNMTRTEGVVVHSDDTLADIQLKLDAIANLDASLVSDTENDGKLSLALSPAATEASFSVTDNTGGYDTSGVLNLLGYDATAKTSAFPATLTSIDLDQVANTLNVLPANVQTTALNRAGSFTINAFETVTQTDPNKAGFNIRQHTIDIVSSDTIASIVAKIDALADFSASVVANQIEITTSLVTDNEGNISATGTNNVQLSFANVYEGPVVSGDEAPENHSGTGDDTGLLAQLQFNTLFQGSSANDIALDSTITTADQIHAGFSFAPGDNSLAIDMSQLQHQHVAVNNQFTINEQYQNLISGIGTDVDETERLADNENLMLEGFITERDRISGVNLDEELANMILFQRVYEANARMLSTFNEMAQELLNMVR